MYICLPFDENYYFKTLKIKQFTKENPTNKKNQKKKTPLIHSHEMHSAFMPMLTITFMIRLE